MNARPAALPGLCQPCASAAWAPLPGLGRTSLKVEVSNHRPWTPSRDQLAGQRQVAVPVAGGVARLIGAFLHRGGRSEQGGEVARIDPDPDRARGRRRHVAVGGVDLVDGPDPERRQVGQDLVVFCLVGTVGRPQRAAVVEGLEVALARPPALGEQRRWIVGAIEHQGDIEGERGERGAVAGNRSCAAIAVEIEKGRIRKLGEWHGPPSLCCRDPDARTSIKIVEKKRPRPGLWRRGTAIMLQAGVSSQCPKATRCAIAAAAARKCAVQRCWRVRWKEVIRAGNIRAG